MANSRRQHFVAQFYQRNFGEPMFTNNIRVYYRADSCWNKTPATPRGVGWFPYLYSAFTESGVRTDAFEKYLGIFDDKAAPAMKKAAQEPDDLTPEQREAIAMFIGLAMARTPEMVKTTLDDHIAGVDVNESRILEEDTKAWCEAVDQPYTGRSRAEFLKPSILGAVDLWSGSIRGRMLAWHWTFLRTTREHPFITSDWPVFAQRDERRGVHLVSFPVSSEIALLVLSSAELSRFPLGCTRDIDFEEARVINQQTLDRAQEFVICHQDSFPGDDLLAAW